VSELLFLLFGLPFGEDLYNERPIPFLHWVYLGIAVLCAIGGPMWPTIKARWASPDIAASVAKTARDARVWVAILLLIFVYGTGPELLRRTIGPGVPVSNWMGMPSEPVADEHKVYTQKSVDELAALCAGRTALQCDAFMADENGKWINLEGKIQTIWAAGRDLTGMMIFSGSRGALCTFAKKWRERLSMFHPQEEIKIVGKIANGQQNGMLNLTAGCELRD
jgi:hypothetical protein